MTTMRGMIAVDDHAAAATTDIAPAAHHMSESDTGAAAHTVPESTSKGLGDSPGDGLDHALVRRVRDKTLRLRHILRKSHDADTRALTLDPPPGPALGRAPGLVVNLEVVNEKWPRSFLNECNVLVTVCRKLVLQLSF